MTLPPKPRFLQMPLECSDAFASLRDNAFVIEYTLSAQMLFAYFVEVVEDPVN